MTHLELENLASDYLEGQLQAAQRVAVEAHLHDCTPCRELMGDLKRVLALAHAAAGMEPPPWLVSKIMLATVGERKPTWQERLAAFLRPSPQPRVATVVAMAIFSISVIVSAAGVNLSNVTVADLNPRNWFYQANRSGHLLYARAEKFYYDLRIVYEIESRFRQIRPEQAEPEQGSPPRKAAPGGSTERTAPGGTDLASNQGSGPGIAESITLASCVASQGRSTSR
ncbi:MAG: zf-HC2 domain-containing protein [Acidobacteria bacterium]|nr:zf-HC2 domain-containing protein [Acidobacteriota bacterium]